jgi:CBS domain containing-hemolysin-like protein
MVSTGVNYWAILVAGAAYFILGALWYSPVIFGKAWTQAVGKSKEELQKGSSALQKGSSALKMIWAFVGSLVIAYGLARILSWTGSYSLTDAVVVSLLAAICFLVTVIGISDSMEVRPMKLYLINIFYNIIGFCIMGIIIGVW